VSGWERGWEREREKGKGKGEGKRGRKGGRKRVREKGRRKEKNKEREEEMKNKNIHDRLPRGSPHQPAPVGRRRAAGHGQALEGVRLKGAGDCAQVVHDGEVLRPLSLDALLLELAGEGLEERAGGGASGHFDGGFGFECKGGSWCWVVFRGETRDSRSLD
jgi:hypothetical protein